MLALEKLYNSTDGPHWHLTGKGKPWNFARTAGGAYLSDPCSGGWFGVVCDNATVVQLRLTACSLSGTIPPELGLLTGLQYFYLNRNSLVGSLPSELKLLSRLQFLVVSYNRLVGSLPTELGLLTGLQNLNLGANQLTGSLFTELGLLTGLHMLNLLQNRLVGSLPTELGLLFNLQGLDLSNNRHVGPLPTELGLMTGLEYFDLGNNSLVGSLPTELGLLMGLRKLYLYRNSLVGSLPTELGLLTGLQGLDMSSNGLSRSLPTELGLLRRLFYFNLDANSLSGSLPTELGQMTGLYYLSLLTNSLAGSLPTELGLLIGLEDLYLNSNSLVGSLPTELGLITDLHYLDLYSNSLVGSLPTELGLLTGLQIVVLNDNRLEGSLPTELGLLKDLVWLLLDTNSLVGSLPTELWLMTGLQMLSLASNSLVGSLPTELGLMKGLEVLYLESNSLKGYLPTELALLTGLQRLDLSSNSLEGSLHTELGLLTRLKQLALYSNSLVGSLPEQFSNLDSLALLDVNDNNLNGQVPSKLPPNLAVLSLAKNCFTGTLAPSLCDATSLQYLILDGLSAGDACQIRIWTGNHLGFTALRSTSRMSGSIPACIYSLPNLKTLHVSGNGLRGSLQAGPTSLSANLTDLSLSHNALTGEAPPSLKLRLGQLAKLDLSYNRLGGTLDGFHPASNQSGLFSMELNRLSGVIPSAITRIKGAVSVLQGNLFDCSGLVYRASLPRADPAYNEYSCRSHSIDVYLFVFTSFFALSAVSYCFLSFRWRPMLHWLASRNKAALAALQRRPVAIQAVLYRVRSLAVLAGSVLLLVYLPLYGALKPFFKTYDFQYSWTVAAIMLSGTAPAAVLLAFWTLALAAASASILVWFCGLRGSAASVEAEAEAKAAPAAAEARNKPTWSERGRLALRLAIIGIFNVGVAGAANFAFVEVTVGDFSNDIKSLATVALGLYKTAWGVVLPHIIDSKALLLGVDRAVEEQSKFLKAGDMFRTLLQIVNNVVMPAVAVAVTDPSCFKHLLFAAPNISTKYSWKFENVRSKFGISKPIEVKAMSVDFTPAFSYNCECTSTLVEKFAPVFAQVALTSAFVFPLLAVGARRALDSLQSSGLGDRLPGLRSVLLAMLPSLLLYRKSERDAPGCLRFMRRKKFIKADEVLQQLVTDVALMLSIGLVAPLLGLMFAASIVSRCLMWEFLVDRFLSLPDEHLEGDLQTLEKQCLQLGSLGRTALYNARWLLAIFPSLFLALFVADMAGDAAGIENALWAPILMSLLPPAVLFTMARLLPAAWRALPENSPDTDTRVSFAPSSEILSESQSESESEPRPVTDNPLHEAALTPSIELVELGDDIPEPTEQPALWARSL